MRGIRFRGVLTVTFSTLHNDTMTALKRLQPSPLYLFNPPPRHIPGLCHEVFLEFAAYRYFPHQNTNIYETGRDRLQEYSKLGPSC